MEHHLTVIIVAIVALGVGAQWIAWRTHLPAIILLAVAGLLAGPVFGVIDPSAEFGSKLPSVISLCVAIILFEGGLNLQLHELKVAAAGVRRLVYAGAPLAWGFSTAAAHYIGGIGWPVASVFGAIMVVTGPTVIMPMLRQARLNRRTASYFKWEGIVNDPIGALLAVLVFQFISFQDLGIAGVVQGLGWALLSGGLLGGVGGWLTGIAFKKGMVPEYLKSPVMLGLVLVVYVLSNQLQSEAGLLAVTIMGITVGNMRLAGIQDMKRFKEYITVMLVAVVFVILTADLDREVLGRIDWRGAALVASVLLLTRPATIMLATVGAGMDMRDRLLLSWIAPRGIVAAATAGVMGTALAKRAAELGPEGALLAADAQSLLPLVFAVIFATVFFHGISIRWLARRLELATGDEATMLIVGASPWSIALATKLNEIGVQVLVADSSWHKLRNARLAGIPVFYGEILSDFAEESVEISHVGTVLAATSNDAYNALVCTALSHEVGRSKVFQLPMGAGDEEDPRGVSRPLRGQPAFDQNAVFERLWRLQVRGWKFYRTRITENYKYSDFLRDFPAEGIQIMLLRADGGYRLMSTTDTREPAVGETILYFAPERQVARERPDTDSDGVTPAPVLA
ncbi:MAG: cation:proton antiporter [Gammaproteobacteria bacterium]|nr:cation:proton antiporter [Gammaproteobacteria bacterium]NNF61008.1 sodium:proton antiporter [Gammaproteobacteria bacterium]NNM21078.1 sodium:proton antiporter [Gammaproteobacteria bacterium]